MNENDVLTGMVVREGADIETPRPTTVRIAELGRPPITLEVPVGGMTIQALVNGGFLSAFSNSQFYVNMRPADGETVVLGGDSIVAVKQINAG